MKPYGKMAEKILHITVPGVSEPTVGPALGDVLSNSLCFHRMSSSTDHFGHTISHE